MILPVMRAENGRCRTVFMGMKITWYVRPIRMSCKFQGGYLLAPSGLGKFPRVSPDRFAGMNQRPDRPATMRQQAVGRPPDVLIAS